MTFSKHLFDLQVLDNIITEKTDSLSTVISKINDNKILDQAKRKLVSAQEIFSKYQTDQRGLESILDDIKEKANATETKLYGGTLTNPRELSGFQEELRLLKSRQEQQEEILLEVLVKIEEAESVLSNLKEILEKIDLERGKELKNLSEEKQIHQKELNTLGLKRDSIKVNISNQNLSLYESLRKSKNGAAVVTMDRNICSGCRIEIPKKIIQQLRGGNSLTQCNSCGRILHLN